MLDRRETDLARVTNEMADYPPDGMLTLAIVTDATVLGSALAYRWTYTCQEAWLVNSLGQTPVLRSPGRTFHPCYSMSEMSNGFQVSYGVTLANLPAAFTPQRIPSGFGVILSPHRRSDGALVWLIINTQAIDGICT